MLETRSQPLRILEIDVLRGLAAISVLCGHYTTWYTVTFKPSYPTLFDFPWGPYGVHLFFMISGFVIFMTLEKTKKPEDFVIWRFSRLYPCYWAAVCITFVASHLCHFSLRQDHWWQAMINLTMFQEFFNVPTVDGVYWTLAAEMSFYLLMLLLLINKRLKSVEGFGLVWLLIMIIAVKLKYYDHLILPFLLRHTYLFKYGHLFIAGIIFYNMKSKGKTLARFAILALCLATGFLVRESSLDIYVEAAFFGIFYFLIEGYLKFINVRPLVFLGTISYSLYLTHCFLGAMIMIYLYSNKANPWVCFLVPTFLCIALATVLTFTIEKPAMRKIRQLYDKSKD